MCAEVLLALVGTMGGWPHAAGVGEPQWCPIGVAMWWCLWLLPLVGRTRAKWQCVATTRGGHECTEALLALVATMGS